MGNYNPKQLDSLKYQLHNKELVRMWNRQELPVWVQAEIVTMKKNSTVSYTRRQLVPSNIVKATQDASF